MAKFIALSHVKALLPQLNWLRHHIHAPPELRGHEQQMADLVVGELRRWDRR